MRISRLLFSSTLLFAPLASAQEHTVPPAFERGGDGESFDPDQALPKLIRVQVEYIEMAHEKLTALLEEKGDSDDAALRLKVRDAITAKEAKILETFVVTSRSGHKTTVESADEFIYPTEYEPMEIVEPPTEKAPPEATKTPFCPTAFETRNLGSSLEIEPTVGENSKIIDLRLEPNMTWHTGNLVWAEDKDTIGNVSKIETPRFYSIKARTSVTCQTGKPLFIAVHSPKSDRGEVDTSRKVMVFVKCDVVTVK